MRKFIFFALCAAIFGADFGERVRRDMPAKEAECMAGELEICAAIADMFRDGIADISLKKDESKAIKYATKACDGGELRGCQVLGQIAASHKDFKSAKKYYKKSCNQTEAIGCYGLGVLYELGLGEKADRDLALKYYELACQKDSTDACYNIGVLHHKAQEYELARPYFEITKKKLRQICEQTGVRDACETHEKLTKAGY